MAKKLLERFTKNNLREKVINSILNGKTTILVLIVGLIKKTSSLYNMSYFTESRTHSKNKIKVVLGFATSVYTSEFTKKTDLACNQLGERGSNGTP